MKLCVLAQAKITTPNTIPNTVYQHSSVSVHQASSETVTVSDCLHFVCWKKLAGFLVFGKHVNKNQQGRTVK